MSIAVVVGRTGPPKQNRRSAVADVVVIGAGVAGLTAAYRLRSSGHRVTVLEAKSCPGGLSQTARNGTVVTEVHDGQQVTQTARLPYGAYINLGPGRFPHHHRRILGLCRELGVALEPYTMSSDANWYGDTQTGQRYRRRRIEHDARGHVAEFAYGCSRLYEEERDLVRSFGDLTAEGEYHGTQRAGDGKVIPFEELAVMRFWSNLFWQPDAYLWQDSMFQPRCGMDQVWRGLLARGLDEVVQYNAPVERIANSARGVRVTWRWGGHTTTRRFDWCVSSIPLPRLAETRLTGFSRDYRAAIDTPEFAPACKVGWTSYGRWWENDENQCYGGISYTDHPIKQFWYPSTEHFASMGTLTGAYNSYETAARFAELSVPERLALAREGGELLHHELGDTDTVPDENAVTVAWSKVPYQAGGWCHWDPNDPRHGDAFAALQVPDNRFVAIGDQVSAWPGWQEGCVQTAERAAAYVDEVIPQHEVPPVEVPDSRWLTEGDHPDH